MMWFVCTRQLMQQQQMVQSHMMMSPQARSQEMLASTPHRQPQALGADALYQQYGPPGRRSALYQRDMEVRSMANFTSLKTGPQSQVDIRYYLQQYQSHKLAIKAQVDYHVDKNESVYSVYKSTINSFAVTIDV